MQASPVLVRLSFHSPDLACYGQAHISPGPISLYSHFRCPLCLDCPPTPPAFSGPSVRARSVVGQHLQASVQSSLPVKSPMCMAQKLSTQTGTMQHVPLAMLYPPACRVWPPRKSLNRLTALCHSLTKAPVSCVMTSGARVCTESIDRRLGRLGAQAASV
jgi:hypothetical protein